ncbi:MAG: zinc-binding dehydrogenase [Nannocystaceae bacterium]|nr:zinc-binding dehydrogenase [Nannocystaceae bacterium]
MSASSSPATGLCAIVRTLASDPAAALAQLELQPQPPIDPASLADDDVIIAVHAANVGWVDLLMTSGQYQHVPQLPYTPGLEYAGVLTWCGPAVRGLSPGDAVIADGLRTGPRSQGAHRRWGGFATAAVAPAHAVVPLPAGLSFDEGACLLGGAETADHALLVRARVRAGETVLVLGASGSTGLAAVVLAKHLGASVIAVGRDADKLAVAQARGADALVVLREGVSLRDEVKRLTDGRGADVIYDPVGGALSHEALRAAAWAARFVVVGWAATPGAARGGREPNALPTNLVLLKSIDVLGSPAAIAAQRDDALRRERLARVLADAVALRPHVGAALPLAALREAMTQKWHGKVAGNFVVRPR